MYRKWRLNVRCMYTSEEGVYCIVYTYTGIVQCSMFNMVGIPVKRKIPGCCCSDDWYSIGHITAMDQKFLHTMLPKKGTNVPLKKNVVHSFPPAVWTDQGSKMLTIGFNQNKKILKKGQCNMIFSTLSFGLKTLHGTHMYRQKRFREISQFREEIFKKCGRGSR